MHIVLNQDFYPDSLLCSSTDKVLLREDFWDYVDRFAPIGACKPFNSFAKQYEFLVYCIELFNGETLQLEPHWVSGFWPGNVCWQEETLNELLKKIEACACKMRFEFTCKLSSKEEVMWLERRAWIEEHHSLY